VIVFEDETARLLACSILGADDDRRVERQLDRFCREHLGAGVEELLFCRVSIGVVFGLSLQDGRAVALKAHSAQKSAEYLRVVHRVQRHLSEQGFPAPAPFLGPEPFRLGLATVDALVEGGEIPDMHDPAARKEMAMMLARLVGLASAVADCDALVERRWAPGGDALWPQQHHGLVDVDGTARGAEWIDGWARRALDFGPRSAGRVVVGHGDWSAWNVRFRDGRLNAVFDWDSLMLDHEPVVVGGAAVTFPYAPGSVEKVASPDEVAAFVAEYELGRALPFSRAERHAVGAAATYQLAYYARCEHAAGGAGRPPSESPGAALRAHGDAYLSL
jgi:Ser/Thr protein kinase RdoA (MazF antagonist)